MRGLSQRIMSMSPEERENELDRAAAVLAAGGCVVMPTETVYGVFTQANHAGFDLLEQVTGKSQLINTPRFTLHMSDPEPVVSMLELKSPVARRLVKRLLPGPVRLVIRQPERVLQRVCESLGIERGQVEDGESIAMRVPDHPITRAIIRRSGHPCVARGLGASRWGTPGKAGTLEGSSVLQGDDQPGAVIDDGPTLYGRGSTTIDLWPDGRFSVNPDGAIDEAQVMRVLNSRVIFVCTGNTCRSPMAAAIARDWARHRDPDGLSFEFDSAGIAAGEGYPAADQAIETMHQGGMELGNHRSKLLTAGMIDRADVIFTMTPSHAQAVMQMAPGSVHKVFPIDPLHPIDDPIGQPVEVYRVVADQLRALISARMQEMIDD